jgi:hypothetical protein
MTAEHDTRNRASRERLAAVAKRLGDREVRLDDGWTAGGLLAHLAFWDRFGATRIEKYLRDRHPMEFGSDPLTEYINAAGLPLWTAMPVAAAGDLAVRAATSIDRLIEGLPKEDLDAIRAMNRPRVLDRSPHRVEHLGAIERALANRG